MKQLILCLALAACGGGGGEGGGDDDQPAMPDAAVQPLTCKSVALCTTYDVKTFIGEVPAPAGGTVESGLYRLAYVVAPSNVNETPGYRDDLDVLMIRGTYFNWAGFFRNTIGTISTSGSVITFQDTQYCSYGEDGDAATTKKEYKYTAMAGELRIYSHVWRSDGVEWDEMMVYKQTQPQGVCETVSTEPQQPADSAKCRVTNCACNFALEGTVQSCT
jgi:hypothetical protein